MDILKVLNSPDMEVKRRAIGIALEMVSSRNVEDVVLFLKKQLQGTMDQEFDKVGRRRTTSLTVEPRIPTTPHPIHPLMCHQILRSRRQCRLRPHGLFGRFQQPFGCGRHCLCSRGSRKVPRVAFDHYRKAHLHLWRDQKRQGVPRSAVDCRRVLHHCCRYQASAVRDSQSARRDSHLGFGTGKSITDRADPSAFWTKQRQPTRTPRKSNQINPKPSPQLESSPTERTPPRLSFHLLPMPLD